MLAVVKDREGPGFSLKEVDIPEPGKGEVLIKVKAVGICGSDIPIFNGSRKVPIPLIPGHEFSGEIVDVGEGVDKFKKGDRVTAGIVINCGRCRYCREGLESMCENILETGIHVDGAFAEYVTVPQHTLHKLPEDMTYVEGASIDPIASAYRPVQKAGINTSDIVVVYGPGPIGLYALQLAIAEGAKRTIMVGTRESRLKVARELGADVTINIREKGEDPIKVIKEYTHGQMADVVIEATGRPDVMDMCLSSLKKAGRLSLAGIFHNPAQFSISQIVRREYTIKGSLCYTWNEFDTCIDMLNTGKVKIDSIVTHELDLKDMEKALELIKSRKAIKIVLHP